MIVLLGSLFASASASDAAAPADDESLLAAYEAVRVPLVEDRLDGAQAAARQLADGPGVPAEVAGAASAVTVATDADAARRAFGELSRALVIRFQATAVPDGMRIYRCPMAAGFQYWLQADAGIANPYMGTSMPTCGEGTSFKAAVRAATP